MLAGAPTAAIVSVTVSVPARLHLGFLDLNGGLGRRFGGVGLAIDQLRTCLTVRPASHMHVSGPESERIRRHLEVMADFLALEAHDAQVHEVVPAHAGLGSGTQLALATAAGMRALHALPLDVTGDAVRLGRGARSGLGIGLFERGGVVVDGGRGGTGVAPIISRLSFPEPWRVLLVLDPHRQGAHGADETAAFAHLAPAPDSDAAHLCRLLVMRILPALVERDLASFGAGIEEMQARIGDYFAPVQGGRRFASGNVASALAQLARAGAVGAGQSSWGPTGFAFAPSPDAAREIVERVRPYCAAVDIRICKGLNAGADIVVNAMADAVET
jgi:beta-RFAP synthase